jgi:chromosome segregation ATPase
MTSDSTTRWPLLEERAPFATASGQSGRRAKLPRSAWLLVGLAFLCGGLVSAAGFSIGWRHQAQRDTAAQAALTVAAARANRLEHRISALRSSLAGARRSAARARATAAAATASEQALARTGAKVDAEATASGREASSLFSGASSITGAATRISSELKTLDTYLTTTPTNQLDPGYIASQTSYLTRQLTRLQGDAGNLDASVTSFEASLRKLGRDAAALTTP